jgi:hypothetical protein
MRCTVCDKTIEGTLPLVLKVDNSDYPICSSVCHARFEENPDQYVGKAGRRRKPWFKGRKRCGG